MTAGNNNNVHLKPLNELTKEELPIRVVFSNLDGIINTADKMTSGNFMHSKNNIKLCANIVISTLNKLGLERV